MEFCQFVPQDNDFFRALSIAILWQSAHAFLIYLHIILVAPVEGQRATLATPPDTHSLTHTGAPSPTAGKQRLRQHLTDSCRVVGSGRRQRCAIRFYERKVMFQDFMSEKVDRKLKLLELANQLHSVSEACRRMGVSRDTFYRAKQAYRRHGEQGLHDITRKKPNFKNRVQPEIEEAVLEFSLSRPSYGQGRVSQELAKRGIRVSPGGVRCIWQRHGLETTDRRVEAKLSAPTASAQIQKAGSLRQTQEPTAHQDLSSRPTQLLPAKPVLSNNN
jgi:transposase